MSAKEMFEELGYKQEINYYNQIKYCKEAVILEGRIIFTITFLKLLERVSIEPQNVIDLDELQAINKQVEELGWEISNI